MLSVYALILRIMYYKLIFIFKKQQKSSSQDTKRIDHLHVCEHAIY